MMLDEIVNILKKLYAETDDAKCKIALMCAIEKVSKDIPKFPVKLMSQPRYGMGYEYFDYTCPTCGSFLAFEPEGNRRKEHKVQTRCEDCGQIIDWSESVPDKDYVPFLKGLTIEGRV